MACKTACEPHGCIVWAQPVFIVELKIYSLCGRDGWSANNKNLVSESSSTFCFLLEAAPSPCSQPRVHAGKPIYLARSVTVVYVPELVNPISTSPVRLIMDVILDWCTACFLLKLLLLLGTTGGRRRTSDPRLRQPTQQNAKIREFIRLDKKGNLCINED